MTESHNIEAFLKIFTFDKKRELEKHCRDLVINSNDFVGLILACDAGRLPFLHRIHYRDHVPEHLHLSDQDLASLAGNPVGPLLPGAHPHYALVEKTRHPSIKAAIKKTHNVELIEYPRGKYDLAVAAMKDLRDKVIGQRSLTTALGV